jgi:hypothetical protein
VLAEGGQTKTKSYGDLMRTLSPILFFETLREFRKVIVFFKGLKVMSLYGFQKALSRLCLYNCGIL